jgi:1-acyl-sn-glycerol-3-phosphate acyltransferase
VSQSKLLRERRFAPLFWTQLLGALNDNLFKNAMVVLLGFRASARGELSPAVLVNLAAGVFILPFLLFSPTAGQIADRCEKSALVRAVKLLEIAVMLLGALGLIFNSLWLLFCVLFLMGSQSALFGPVKYSILPQHLREQELVGGNGLVEMGTFVAILVGTILGGLLIAVDGRGPYLVSAAIIALAVAGYLASRAIPRAESNDPGLRLGFNPLRQGHELVSMTRQNRAVYLSILGISWFWAYGSIFLAQLPDLTRGVLGGDEGVVVLLLTVFSLGIGLGSLLCERLSGKRIELGLVPFGSLGLTLFGLDFFFALSQTVAAGELAGAGAFVARPGSLRVLCDLGFIGVFGGLYIVPLYAMLQQRSLPQQRSRIIAANNVLNALLVVASALIAAGLRAAGLSASGLLLVAVIANAAVAVAIYRLLPEFFLRFIFWVLTHTVYRVRKSGLQNLPPRGPAVVVCNHVSYLDALFIASACPQPMRFVMDHRIFRLPLLHHVFRLGRAIPIASARDNPELMERAFEEIASALGQGDIVCIFPEGRLTPDGEINTFRAGVERIVRRTPVPVIPLALRGLWGNVFSRNRQSVLKRLTRSFLCRIELVGGAPVPPWQVSAPALELAVRRLRGDVP